MLFRSPDLLELSIHSRFESLLASDNAPSDEDLELLDEVPMEDALVEAEEDLAEKKETPVQPESSAPATSE